MTTTTTPSVQIGTVRNDAIEGLTEDNVILGAQGNDYLVAGKGSNLIDGDYTDANGWVKDSNGEYVYVGTSTTNVLTGAVNQFNPSVLTGNDLPL